MRVSVRNNVEACLTNNAWDSVGMHLLVQSQQTIETLKECWK